MSVVTRFAPSPTGMLHIGGARTALFNWLFAKHHGGSFRLRIEDTDRKRSTDAARAAILDGMTWLGLGWDGDALRQSTRAARHVEIAEDLLDAGKAYRCYATPEELGQSREAARAAGKSFRYDGRWRDRDDAPPGIAPAIRFKAPRDGETVIADLVQGEVRVGNEELDDMVILRADGTPTYMLSVVVDDHDMGITHVIRGDDHLTNAFRQAQLFKAIGWEIPQFAHIPLIHGADGARMSKRHGALGVEAYREMGYLPEAMRNYLLRLGWSHGDDEIIDIADAIDWFELGGIGRAPARFDIGRLESLNAHYMRQIEDSRLALLVLPGLAQRLGRKLGDADRARLEAAFPEIKPRSKTIVELIEKVLFYFLDRPLPLTPKAAKVLDDSGLARLRDVAAALAAVEEWDSETLEAAMRDIGTAKNVKLGEIAQPLRAALTGATVSPGIFEVMAILGRNEVLGRIEDALAERNAAAPSN